MQLPPSQTLFGRRGSLPMIRQTEVAECANACLAMVAVSYGLQTDMAALRRRFPGSARGVTLRNLMENATAIGFTTRALKVDIDHLEKVVRPAILHWDLNHFVVLAEITNKVAVVHDPAFGIRKLSLEELGKHYTGIALELVPRSDSRPRDERTKIGLSSLWTRINGLSRAIIQVLLLSAVILGFTLAIPQYLQTVIDHVLPSSDRSLLVVIAIGFALFQIFSIAASALRSMVLLHAGTTMAYHISINLFSHLLRLPLPYFARRHVGDIVARFGSIEPIKDFLTQGVTSGIIDGVMAIGTLVLMFFYSPALAFLSLGALLLILLFRLVLFPAFFRATESEIVANAAESSAFIENMRGMQTIKAFAIERTRQERWQHFLTASFNERVRVQKFEIGFSTFEDLVEGLSQILIVFVAARMALQGDLTIGMIFAFMAYRDHFNSSLTSLIDLIIEFRMLRLHLDRLSDIATTNPDPSGGINIKIEIGKIEFQSVSFRYDDGQPEVIDNASFVINKGESVGLIGPSGSGKTTLLKMMMGLLPKAGGEILIDDVSLSRLDPHIVRSQIASVMQDDLLFSGSIADNISLFDPTPDVDWIHHCAKLACIHDDIIGMSMGYETLVGDMGSSLSGGQVQRILLARALYRRPAILFIDEGTSNLDVATERMVSIAIQDLGITRVVVAHRPNTIQSLDRLLEVKDAQVVEVSVDRSFA
jgi:ATP-binding cassette, subfamily B, bacterial CvaB/MchF/RaxB